MTSQNELQAIARQVAEYLKLELTPIVEVKLVERGLARPKTRRITIPKWVLDEKCQRQAYQVWYVAHEVTHFATGAKHSARFKQVEKDVLSEVFGIEIVRFRRRQSYPWRPPSDHHVYAEELLDKKTKKVLWQKGPGIGTATGG